MARLPRLQYVFRISLSVNSSSIQQAESLQITCRHRIQPPAAMRLTVFFHDGKIQFFIAKCTLFSSESRGITDLESLHVVPLYPAAPVFPFHRPRHIAQAGDIMRFAQIRKQPFGKS